MTLMKNIIMAKLLLYVQYQDKGICQIISYKKDTSFWLCYPVSSHSYVTARKKKISFNQIIPKKVNFKLCCTLSMFKIKSAVLYAQF